MSDPVLSVEDLCFSHGDGFRLQVEHFELQAGERVALIGPSGCGKTTFLHLIAGILQADRGRIEVLGQRVDQLDERARRAFRIGKLGLVFQEFELLDYLTAGENLLLPFRLHPHPPSREQARARTAELAERLGLTTLLDRRPARLSQGERQRVALGRALAVAPGIVLGDEPTGNLDPDNARRSLDLLSEQAAADGAAVLVVTHDHGLLNRFDRVVELPALAGLPT
jgi:putative ABC transport system ATP-binding protein